MNHITELFLYEELKLIEENIIEIEDHKGDDNYQVDKRFTRPINPEFNEKPAVIVPTKQIKLTHTTSLPSDQSPLTKFFIKMEK